MYYTIKANDFDGFTWVLRNAKREVLDSGTAETRENAERMAKATLRWFESFATRITHNSDANL